MEISEQEWKNLQDRISYLERQVALLKSFSRTVVLPQLNRKTSHPIRTVEELREACAQAEKEYATRSSGAETIFKMVHQSGDSFDY